jgi:transcriptional regulator with XRE-family HTH domain
MLMSAALASSEGVGFVICEHSQNANYYASADYRKSGDAFLTAVSHDANMVDDQDKNGGPNHLKAWMRFRKVTGARLADKLDITPGMVSDLVNSNRALSAKWLRRIAPALNTTPGLLLDHDPFDLDSDIIEIWINASTAQKRQISEVAKTLVKTGTSDR